MSDTKKDGSEHYNHLCFVLWGIFLISLIARFIFIKKEGFENKMIYIVRGEGKGGRIINILFLFLPLFSILIISIIQYSHLNKKLN